jgi:cell wall-associated NlpC family hydrolase
VLRTLPALVLAFFALAVPAWASDSWVTTDPGVESGQQPSWQPDPPQSQEPSGGMQGWDPGGQAWNPTQGDAEQATPPPAAPPAATPSPSGAGDWPTPAPLPISKTPTVAGTTAMLRRNGLAAIPLGAPAPVKAIIAAANQIIGKPYKWGGGHGRLFDSGYDCSGSVSYALIRSGILAYPMVSGTFAHWGAKGAGAYLTIYANKSHVYMEIAGLRLDTSPVGDPAAKSGVRWRPPIGKRFSFAVRHVPGL